MVELTGKTISESQIFSVTNINVNKYIFDPVCGQDLHYLGFGKFPVL